MRDVLVVAACALMVMQCAAQTEWTYQGELTENGQPADGAYELAFTLWDAPVGGSQIGAEIFVQDVPVSDGLFMQVLDFGAEAFSNEARYLQIEVEGDVLSPRTQITRSPYSIQTRGIYVDADEQVGIGTTDPAMTLEVRKDIVGFDVPTLGVSGASDNGERWLYMSGGDRLVWADGSDLRFATSQSIGGLSATHMALTDEGRLGIGTVSPATPLEVFGADLVMQRLSSSNQTGTWLDLENRSAGGGNWSLISTGSGNGEGAGKLALYSLDAGQTAMTLQQDGSVGIGTGFPKQHLHNAGDYYGRGHLWLHAFEGDGASGTAYVQARDDSGISSINLRLRTQFLGAPVDAMWVEPTSVQIGGEHIPQALLKAPLYVEDNQPLSFGTFVINKADGQDGAMVTFEVDGSVKGSISVAGETVSYNAFTGSHYVHVDSPPMRGTLLRMTGENRPGGEVVYGAAPTTVANDQACIGSYLGPLSEAGADVHLAMAAGNGEMWVMDSGTGDLAPGDALISSDVEGCAMKDDPNRFEIGYVIARCAERVEWDRVTPDADGVRRARVSVLFGAHERHVHRDDADLRGRIAELERMVEALVESRE